MKIGFTTLFSWRPHVEHAFYIASQLKSAGHELYFLNCPGGLPSCYTQELRPGSPSKECFKCKLGSLYSYTNENNTYIDKNLSEDLPEYELQKLVGSSSYTLARIEDPKDQELQELKEIQERLKVPVQTVYANAKKWIQNNQLDFVFLFNGRIDLTQSVYKACLDTKTPCSSMERTYSGHGIMLNFNENCLNLKGIHKLVKQYESKPLTKEQALKSAHFLTKRFRDEPLLEWREYNKNSIYQEWKIKNNGLKVLIMPSSRNEVWCEEQWKNNWVEFPLVFEKILKKLNVPMENCILRAHPNWGEKIGHNDGKRITKYYQQWCLETGVNFIDPQSKVSSSHLIQQADVVLLNGSTAIYETALLGIPTVNTAKCESVYADIADVLLCEEDLKIWDVEKFLNKDKSENIRRLLRFIYTYAYRYALFNKEIRSLTPHHFRYAKNIDVKRLEEMMKTQQIIPDDTSNNNTEEAENEVINLILKKDWNSLNHRNDVNITNLHKVKRRSLYLWVDSVRNIFKRGDI